MKDKKILIIDDDEALCEELAELLKDEGYVTAHTSDASVGEDLIRGNGFDTVLLDYKMPRITGIEILKKLKRDNIRIRIIMMTGRPLIEQEITAEDLSDMISGILYKPVNFETLLERIENTP